jgi:hypothetical protein
LPGAVLIYISACTIVLDDPRHTVYYVCMYVLQTKCGVTELKVNTIFLFYEMFRSAPVNNGFQQCFSNILIIILIIIILLNLLGIF